MSSASRIMSQMERLAGGSVLTRRELKDHALDGAKPQLMIAPESEEQVAEVVRLDHEGQVILVAVGSEHQVLDVRRPNDGRPIVLLSTRNLQQSVNYSPEDLTLTVQSGMTLGALDQMTGSFAQHLPIDPPCAATATLGGVVATAACGPRGLMHGHIGACVLGGHMVLANGDLVKSGAGIVKSVAGYDLHKLLVGSYGSLGIITRVSLKLAQVPEDFRLAELRADHTSEAVYTLGQLLRGKSRPCMVTMLNQRAAGELGYATDPGQVVVLIAYEDNAEAVEWQLAHLHLTYGDKIQVLDTATSLAKFRHLVEWPVRPCRFSFEAIVLGGGIQQLFDHCTQHEIAVVSHANSGIVLGRGDGDITPQLAAALREAAGQGSTVKFIALPQGSQVSRWGGVDQARVWMRRVKTQFDPRGIFPWPGFLGS